MGRRPLFLDDGFGVGVHFARSVEERVTEKSQREDGEVLEGILSRERGEITANGVASIFVRHVQQNKVRFGGGFYLTHVFPTMILHRIVLFSVIIFQRNSHFRTLINFLFLLNGP